MEKEIIYLPRDLKRIFPVRGTIETYIREGHYGYYPHFEYIDLSLEDLKRPIEIPIVIIPKGKFDMRLEDKGVVYILSNPRFDIGYPKYLYGSVLITNFHFEPKPSEMYPIIINTSAGEVKYLTKNGIREVGLEKLIKDF